MNNQLVNLGLIHLDIVTISLKKGKEIRNEFVMRVCFELYILITRKSPA